MGEPMTLSGLFIALLTTKASFAQEPAAPTFDDDLWAELDQMPPRTSSELAFHVGFGDITYWRAEVPPWLLFGVRGGWGLHVGESRQQRVGVALTTAIEGPFPEFYSVAVDPAATWDFVKNGLWVGAGAGPSLMLHGRSTVSGPERFSTFTGHVEARIGWSQPYSRLVRRAFVGLEPKLRAVDGEPNWGVALVVGSTRGW